MSLPTNRTHRTAVVIDGRFQSTKYSARVTRLLQSINGDNIKADVFTLHNPAVPVLVPGTPDQATDEVGDGEDIDLAAWAGALGFTQLVQVLPTENVTAKSIPGAPTASGVEDRHQTALVFDIRNGVTADYENRYQRLVESVNGENIKVNVFTLRGAGGSGLLTVGAPSAVHATTPLTNLDLQGWARSVGFNMLVISSNVQDAEDNS